ncbi:phage baseplate assembly protein V [Rhizobium sp. CFBP 8762]|uniref:phage baseplate assembly protein V n=1 Tax=Rhizobium sp. CFBP 8762 TaxID=2775279 RepID=UPI00177E0A2E|nr:phage baseplate assembly protein V [Rhizobium sp. CFBP 8762]MBD8556905.1 phage baseplate assembly protein V [Rhizobium sp. CFBP 8762]
MIPHTLPDQLADLYSRVNEIERRARNRKRTGTIAEVDHEQGKYRVMLSSPNGKPYLSPWIRSRSLGAGGVKIDVLLTKGEQVDVVSESGDLTDAVIDMSTYSNANARENTSSPLHIKIGDTVFAADGGALTLVSGQIVMNGDVTITGNVAIEGGSLTHNGVNIGSTHIHGGVKRAGEKTDPPIQ